MGKISWPQAIIFMFAVGVVGALVWKGVDAGGVSAFVLALVGGLLYARQDQIKDQTNGRMSEMLATIEKLGDQLAQSHPPARPVLPAAPVYDADRTGESTPPSAPSPPSGPLGG